MNFDERGGVSEVKEIGKEKTCPLTKPPD